MPKKVVPKAVPLYIIVTDALCEFQHGSAECVLGTSIRRPVHTDWYLDGLKKTSEDIHVSDDGLSARHLPAGSECRIVVTDADDEVHEASVRVDVCALPVVVAYETRDATTKASRDGGVRATVLRAPEGCRYLWTCGIVTTRACLEHVPSGTYCVSLLTSEGGSVPFVHCSEVATVGVKQGR